MTLSIGVALYFVVFAATSYLSEKYTPVVGVGGLMLLLAVLYSL